MVLNAMYSSHNGENVSEFVHALNNVNEQHTEKG